MAERLQRLDDHRDQAPVRRADLLPGARVQLPGRDGDHGPVPTVADERQLPAHVRLDLRLGGVGVGHGGLDLGGPDGEVDGAQLLDHGGARAEVLVDRGPSQARALGEGREGQGLRPPFGQQGAGGVQQGAALHRPVLGH